MKIYTTSSKSDAEQLRQLFELNSECAKLHWSRSINDVPDNVINALETIESFVEARVCERCDFLGELSEDSENMTIELIRNNPKLKETLGTGVITIGSQTDEVKNIIGSCEGMEEIIKALETEKNIILF